MELSLYYRLTPNHASLEGTSICIKHKHKSIMWRRLSSRDGSFSAQREFDPIMDE